jgi:hypothetical protein
MLSQEPISKTAYADEPISATSQEGVRIGRHLRQQPHPGRIQP